MSRVVDICRKVNHTAADLVGKRVTLNQNGCTQWAGLPARASAYKDAVIVGDSSIVLLNYNRVKI